MGRGCDRRGSRRGWPSLGSDVGVRQPGLHDHASSGISALTSVLPASCVRGEEGVEVVGQDLRLVNRDEGLAVVDPHQLCVVEVFD